MLILMGGRMNKEFVLKDKRKEDYKQLIIDLRNVMGGWDCPIKFKIQIEEQVKLFKEVMQDLDKEFLKLLKYELQSYNLEINNHIKFTPQIANDEIDKLSGFEDE